MLITLGILSAAGSSRVYATLDPLRHSNNVTTSDGNLTGSNPGNAAGVGIATIGKSSGKWYWEATVNNSTTGTYGKIGVTNVLMVPNSNTPTGLGAGSVGGTGTVGYWGTTIPDGQTKVGANFASSLLQIAGNAGQIVNGDILSVAYNADANQVTFYRNGVLSVTITLSPSGGVWYPAFASTSAPTSVTFNFGQNAWSTNPTVESTRNDLFTLYGYNEGLY
jgi:hypothetical protein